MTARQKHHHVGTVVFVGGLLCCCSTSPALAFLGNRVALNPLAPRVQREIPPSLAIVAASSDDSTNDDDAISGGDNYISNDIPLEVDVAIVGAGLGGLCAGAILNTLYNKQVAIFESHYLAGGCAHAFDRKAKNGQTFTFDSGPTILLGYVILTADGAMK